MCPLLPSPQKSPHPTSPRPGQVQPLHSPPPCSAGPCPGLTSRGSFVLGRTKVRSAWACRVGAERKTEAALTCLGPRSRSRARGPPQEASSGPRGASGGRVAQQLLAPSGPGLSASQEPHDLQEVRAQRQAPSTICGAEGAALSWQGGGQARQGLQPVLQRAGAQSSGRGCRVRAHVISPGCAPLNGGAGPQPASPPKGAAGDRQGALLPPV